MADVFISYRNLQDRRRIVQRFATILRAYDISVWWDHGLEAGASYADQIMRELGEAKLVIPFWCEESVVSQWVLKEAETGRAKLLPLRLQRIAPPDAFEAIHSVHMENWNGSILDPVLDEFVRDICDRLGKSSRIAADSKTELSRLPPIKPLKAPRTPPPTRASARRPGPAPSMPPKPAQPSRAAPFIAVGALIAMLAAGGGVYAFDPMGWFKPVSPASVAPDLAPLPGEPAITSLAAAPASASPSEAPTAQRQAGPAKLAASPASAPAGGAPTEAAKAWASVNTKSASALRAFIAAYASSTEAVTANRRLAALDAAAWITATDTNTAAAYQTYLTTFPKAARPPGAHAVEAEAARTRLLSASATPATTPTTSPSSAPEAAATPPSAPPTDWAELKGKPNVAAPRATSGMVSYMSEAYPAASRRTGEEGVVTVSMCIDTLGKISEVKLLESSGFSRLDDATVKGLPKNRFTPGRQDGRLVAICGYPFSFEWKLVNPEPVAPPPTP